MISPLNKPINVNICKGAGTIFSAGTGQGSGSQTYSFVNLGTNGARVLANVINNVVQFRRLLNGNNTLWTEQANGIRLDVNDLAFDSSLPVKRAIPGLQGVTLNKQGILATLQEILYPTLPPTISLSLNPTQFEYGDNSVIVANYGVTRTDEAIVTISVNNQSITPTGNNQSGTLNVTKNGLVNVTIPMQVTTATKTVNASAIASVLRKIRIGGSIKDGIIAPILDSDINNLANQYFASNGILSPRNFTLSSQYLVIALADALGNTAPTFKINGFVNNAFTKVRDNAFVNTFGYSDNTAVWVSNTTITGTITLEIA